MFGPLAQPPATRRIRCRFPDRALARAFQRLRSDARAWQRLALQLASELGLTQAGRARLQLDVAQTRRTLSLVELHEQARATRSSVHRDETGQRKR